MAEKIKIKATVAPELIRSGGGVFEISIDGELVYSKKSTGEFPADAEIVEMVQNRK